MVGARIRARFQRRYDQLWAQAIAKIRSGTVALDPVLQSKSMDERRGMTVARFRTRLSDGARYAAALGKAKDREFGLTTLGSLDLVESDWYMSRHATAVLKKFNLNLPR